VAILLQNKQCTYRSHESITDKLLYYNTLPRAIYIAVKENNWNTISNILMR